MAGRTGGGGGEIKTRHDSDSRKEILKSGRFVQELSCHNKAAWARSLARSGFFQACSKQSAVSKRLLSLSREQRAVNPTSSTLTFLSLSLPLIELSMYGRSVIRPPTLPRAYLRCRLIERAINPDQNSQTSRKASSRSVGPY